MIIPKITDLPDDWLTIRQVSDLLPGRPHVGTITRWTQKPIRGQILPSTICGGKRLIKRSDLQSFMESFNSTYNSSGNVQKAEQAARNTAAVDAVLSCNRKLNKNERTQNV